MFIKKIAFGRSIALTKNSDEVYKDEKNIERNDSVDARCRHDAAGVGRE